LDSLSAVREEGACGCRRISNFFDESYFHGRFHFNFWTECHETFLARKSEIVRGLRVPFAARDLDVTLALPILSSGSDLLHFPSARWLFGGAWLFQMGDLSS